MHLLLHLTKYSLRFGVFTQDGETIYEHIVDRCDTSLQTLGKLFENDVVTQLRSHGKIFTKIGFVLPFNDASVSNPTLADRRILSTRQLSAVLTYFYRPYDFLLALSKKKWPHIPHFFLSDTCLSSDLDRTTTILPFPHDVVKQFRLSPAVLNSFGHISNRVFFDQKRPFISLVVDDAVSAILFDGTSIKAVTSAYSPYPLLGLGYGGAGDVGLYFDLNDKLRGEKRFEFISNTGLFHAIGHGHDFDSLLKLSGLVPRGESALPDLPIETLEWLELSMRGFINTLRSVLAGLLVHEIEARTAVVTSPQIHPNSPFWKVIFKGSLGHITWVVNPRSGLESAAKYLIKT